MPLNANDAGLATVFESPESRAAYEGMADLRQRKALALLTAFVNVDDVQVRQDVPPNLSLRDPARYPEHARHLVPQAITIARARPDACIRHRLAVQLGEQTTLAPIPNRTSQQRPACDTWRVKNSASCRVE